jgi:uncharacterized protein YuzE
MAHTTEFPLVNRPIPRPVEVIRLLAKGGLPLKIARSGVERLATTTIKGLYYRETDRVHIEIAAGPSAETREVSNGLNVDLDGDGNVIGFDIDNASRLGALLRDFIASGATIEDLARAWASLDGKRDEFDKETRSRGVRGPRSLSGLSCRSRGNLAASGKICARAQLCFVKLFSQSVRATTPSLAVLERPS